MQRFNGHLYWFSWQDNDGSVRNAKWDWFNARNYCRKRCMDLVSIEDEREYQFLKGLMDPGTFIQAPKVNLNITQNFDLYSLSMLIL